MEVEEEPLLLSHEVPKKRGFQPSNRNGAASEKVFIYLYVSHFLSAWGDRIWEFTAPLVFAILWPETILPGAVFGFVGQLFCVLGGPAAGDWVDTTNRLFVVRSTLIIQNVAVMVCGGLLLYLFFLGENKGFFSVTFWMVFLPALVVNGIQSLAAMASSVAVEKDWVVVCCEAVTRGAGLDGMKNATDESLNVDDEAEDEEEEGGELNSLTVRRDELLTQTNSMLKRIDLSCKILAPILLGFLLQYFKPEVAVIVVVCWNLVSLIPEYLFLSLIYKECGMVDRERKSVVSERKGLITSLVDGWNRYKVQTVFLPSIAYVLLFVTVLAPGPLINSWLSISEVSFAVVGFFQAAAAISGISSTWLVPRLLKRVGLEKSGMYALGSQLLALIIGSLPLLIFWRSLPKTTIYIFLGGIVASRCSLWTYDIVEVQIMQEGVAEHERGLVNGVEGALTNVATLVGYLFGMVFHDPNNFIFLILMSLSAVALSFAVYAVHLRGTPS